MFLDKLVITPVLAGNSRLARHANSLAVTNQFASIPLTMRSLSPVVMMMFLALVAVAFAEDAPPKAVGPSEAEAHLLKRIEPIVPPDVLEFSPVTQSRIRVVKLHVLISASGDVAQVNAIDGFPSLVQAAIEAVKQWKYRPFVENGSPIAVVTELTVNFPDPVAELRMKFLPIEAECRKLIDRALYHDAEPKCKEAVHIAEHLPGRERGVAGTLYATSIFQQGRAAEALVIYDLTLESDWDSGAPHDLQMATEAENLARAYSAVGELRYADNIYAKTVSIYEKLIQASASPQDKDNYTQRLRRLLVEYARLKETRGLPGEAEKLRSKATTLH